MVKQCLGAVLRLRAPGDWVDADCLWSNSAPLLPPRPAGDGSGAELWRSHPPALLCAVWVWVSSPGCAPCGTKTAPQRDSCRRRAERAESCPAWSALLRGVCGWGTLEPPVLGNARVCGARAVPACGPVAGCPPWAGLRVPSSPGTALQAAPAAWNPVKPELVEGNEPLPLLSLGLLQ